jgi:hypothetical protein
MSSQGTDQLRKGGRFSGNQQSKIVAEVSLAGGFGGGGLWEATLQPMLAGLDDVVIQVVDVPMKAKAGRKHTLTRFINHVFQFNVLDPRGPYPAGGVPTGADPPTRGSWMTRPGLERRLAAIRAARGLVPAAAADALAAPADVASPPFKKTRSDGGEPSPPVPGTEQHALVVAPRALEALVPRSACPKCESRDGTRCEACLSQCS